MAWEKRNENRYYYRKVRVGDKVKSVYLGKDILAYKHLGEMQEQKALFKEQQAQLLIDEAREKELEENHRLLIAIAETALLLNGYRLHKGEWKRKHG